jgi:hypothetical protein
MPNPAELDFDLITADWTYIRWLGDRKGVEAQTMTWDKAVVDRSEELSSWVDFCYEIMMRGVLIYAYANNHFQATVPRRLRSLRNFGLRTVSERYRGPNRASDIVPIVIPRVSTQSRDVRVLAR